MIRTYKFYLELGIREEEEEEEKRKRKEREQEWNCLVTFWMMLQSL